MTPPRAPRTRSGRAPVGEQLRNAFAIAMGMWPLTAVMLLMLGLLIIASNAGSY
jgi:hypothetical protein